MVGKVSWEFQKHELHKADARNLQIQRAGRKGSGWGLADGELGPEMPHQLSPLPLRADRGTEGFSSEENSP